MKRKKRETNRHFKSIAVDWKLVLERAKNGQEALDITFRGKYNGFSKNTISLLVLMGGGKCYPRKLGTLKKCNKSGEVVGEVPFSLIPDEGLELSRWEKIVNNVIEEVGKIVSKYLPSLRKSEKEIGGTAIIPPKILRIPKMVTVEELSLEGLQAEGQLPMDLKGFKRM